MHALHGDITATPTGFVPGSANRRGSGAGDLPAAWKAIDPLIDDKAAKAWLITILRREMPVVSSASSSISSISTSIPSDQAALHSEQEMEHEWLHCHIARPPAEYQEPCCCRYGGFSGERSPPSLA